MPIERRPRYPVPRGTVPKHSVPHRVNDGESWHSVAARYGLTADQIIYANFWTLVPEEVNWYLRHYVGCKKDTRDGKNWMFSSRAKPGIIHIPPKSYNFSGDTITGKLPTRYFTVTEHPMKWTPPPGMIDKGAAAKTVVALEPWQRTSLSIGGMTIKGRKGWGASEPSWENEVIYYNTAYPLAQTLNTIVVHHTDNDDSIKDVEESQKNRGYAAIGYHFFIDQSGNVYEGRPLEIMGSNSGVGKVSGPENDPDWGAIGITLQGDYHHDDDWFFSSDAPNKQLQSLEDLVGALRTAYSIGSLLMHREVKRGGKATVCPGDHMVPRVKALRKKLGFPEP